MSYNLICSRIDKRYFFGIGSIEVLKLQKILVVNEELPAGSL